MTIGYAFRDPKEIGKRMGKNRESKEAQIKFVPRIGPKNPAFAKALAAAMEKGKERKE